MTDRKPTESIYCPRGHLCAVEIGNGTFECATCNAEYAARKTAQTDPAEQRQEHCKSELRAAQSAERRVREWLEANGYSLWLTANSDSFPRCVAAYAASENAELIKRISDLEAAVQAHKQTWQGWKKRAESSESENAALVAQVKELAEQITGLLADLEVVGRCKVCRYESASCSCQHIVDAALSSTQPTADAYKRRVQAVERKATFQWIEDHVPKPIVPYILKARADSGIDALEAQPEVNHAK